MRRTAGTTAVALVAATLVAGTSVAAAGAQPPARAGAGLHPPAAAHGHLARAALKAVAGHPQAVHAGDRQAFTVTGALVDPNGTSHVRMARTYAGLPVLGGDLVVHRRRRAPGRVQPDA